MKKVIGLIIFLIALLFIFSVLVGLRLYFSLSPEPILIQTPEATSKFSAKAEEYLVAEDENNWPKFVKIIVDPVDVKPGDIQKYQVILHDKTEIKEVIAYIERDSGTTTLPLKKIEKKLVNFKPEESKYLVVKGKLLFNNSEINYSLAKENLNEYVYYGEWKVYDTSSKKYRTVIVATNYHNQKNNVSVFWTDPCTPPLNGDWQVDGNCIIDSLNGVDNGRITGFASSYTLTLRAPFVFNPGKSITINNGGKIVIGPGGYLTQTYLWCQDQDNDGHCTSQLLAQNNQPSGYRRRYLANSLSDCDDLDSAKYQFLLGYYDEDGDGYGYGSGELICSGPSLPPGYVSQGGDCLDNPSNPASIYVNPGQANFFGEPIPGEHYPLFDYNCDYWEEKAYPNFVRCDYFWSIECRGYYVPLIVCYSSGWAQEDIPECGVSGDYLNVPPDGCVIAIGCEITCPPAESLTQVCR